MRKINPGAQLKTLPAETQEALWTWLHEDQTRKLRDAVAWLYSEHDVRTDFRRLSEWRLWFARKLEIEAAQSEASEIEEALKRSGTFSARQLEELGNVIFLNRATKTGDSGAFAKVAAVVQGRERLEGAKAEHQDKMTVARAKLKLQSETLRQTKRRLDQAERKVAALEKAEAERAAAADAAMRRVKDGGASEETIKAVREALGMRE